MTTKNQKIANLKEQVVLQEQGIRGAGVMHDNFRKEIARLEGQIAHYKRNLEDKQRKDEAEGAQKIAADKRAAENTTLEQIRGGSIPVAALRGVVLQDFKATQSPSLTRTEFTRTEFTLRTYSDNPIHEAIRKAIVAPLSKSSKSSDQADMIHKLEKLDRPLYAEGGYTGGGRWCGNGGLVYGTTTGSAA